MGKKIIKEVSISRIERSYDLEMKILLEDGQKLDLVLVRDVAIPLIEQIYVGLDAKNLHRPENLH